MPSQNNGTVSYASFRGDVIRMRYLNAPKAGSAGDKRVVQVKA